LLSRVWAGFFLLAFVAALYQWLVLGHGDIFTTIVNATFEMAKLSVQIAIGLIGVLALWMGFFQLAEKAGLIQILARLLSPLFRRLMPEIPTGHPAQGSITMNLAANMLGLDNAATPMGLKAMQDLQTLNSNKDTASNAMILFLVLNTSSVTPVSQPARGCRPNRRVYTHTAGHLGVHPGGFADGCLGAAPANF
jgi:spore maturation protein SpmA